VHETHRDRQRKILAFAAVVEAATGLALTIDPSLVVALLVGVEVSGIGTLLGRCFGISLLALGLACWPDPQRIGSGDSALRGMFVYNALIASYLTFLGTVRHLEGWLLWPAVALHGVVALLLVFTWHGKRSTKAADK